MSLLSLVTGIGGAVVGGAITGGSFTGIAAGYSAGSTLGGAFDASNAQSQAEGIRTKISSAVQDASMVQIEANNAAAAAQAGFQQVVASGAQASAGAVQQAAKSATVEINKQSGIVGSQSVNAAERTEVLTAEQASAIRGQADIQAGALSSQNTQVEALARAVTAASGVLSTGTPTTYIKELVRTDALRVQDIINVGDRNAELTLLQGQNLVASIQASAVLAQARLHAQVTDIKGRLAVTLAGLEGQIAGASAYESVIGANNAANNAAIASNAAQYGVDLNTPPPVKPKAPPAAYRIAGDKLDYR